jgi:hypothetical protein
VLKYHKRRVGDRTAKVLKALAVLAALASPISATAEPVAEPEPKIVLAFFMNGKVLRGGRTVDESRLRTELAALNKGDKVVVCLQGMNDKVNEAFDRYIMQSPGGYDTQILTRGRCPADPATQGKSASR